MFPKEDNRGISFFFEIFAICAFGLLLMVLFVFCRKGPNILATFCSSCKEDNSDAKSPTHGAISLPCQESRAVLEGLADCLIRTEHGVKVGNFLLKNHLIHSFNISLIRCFISLLLNPVRCSLDHLKLLIVSIGYN